MGVPPFFIVGSARSGTTLLRMVLNAHPRVAVPPESRFLVELHPGEPEVDAGAWLEALGHHRQFQAWNLPLEDVRAELPAEARVPVAVAMAAPYRAYARARDKEVWGDKTPRYVQHIPLIAEVFADARFVHVIRDGRNVALSYADVPFGPRTVGKAAALWQERVNAGLRDGRALGDDRYLEIKYESLVADLESETKVLCNFLGLEYDASMLDYTEKARSDVLPRAKSYNPNVTKSPIANVRSWRDLMRPRDVELFEAVAGDTLSALGYERAYGSPGTAARARASLSRLGLPVARLHGKAK